MRSTARTDHSITTESELLAPAMVRSKGRIWSAYQGRAGSFVWGGRRLALDQLLADARRGQFDVLAVWASDRLARSVRHFLEVLDELNHLGIEFVSFREQLDTGGRLDRAVVIIISAIAELERNLIIERVRAGAARPARGHSHRPAAGSGRSRECVAGSGPRPQPDRDRQRSPHLPGSGQQDPETGKTTNHKGCSPSTPQTPENRQPERAA